MLDDFSDAIVRYRRTVLVIAALVVVVAGALSLGLRDRLTSGWGDWDDHGSANVAAREVIENATGVNTQQGYVLLVRDDQRIDPTMAVPPVVQAAADLLRQRPEVRQVIDYRSTQNPALVSKDKRSTLVIGEIGTVTESKVIPQLEQQIRDNPVLNGHVVVGGSTAGSAQVMSVVLKDLAFAELIIFPLLFVLLVVVFRGVTAALLPLVGGGFAILTSMLAIRIIVEFCTISVFGLDLVLALGLGLSVDFSLLIVSRYREQLRQTDNGSKALRDTVNTAGRTVLFSGLTISSALVGLLIFPQRFLYSMGICGIAVVVAAMLYALVILPALLAVLGHRTESRAPRYWQRRSDQAEDPSAQRWRRIAIVVTGRPVLSASLAAVALLVLASPLLGVKFTAVQSANTLPDGASAGHVAQVMASDFGASVSDQEQVVIDAPSTAGPPINSYAEKLRSIEGVAAVEPPQRLSGNHWLVPISLTGQPNTDTTQDTMHRVENLDPGYPTRFTGPTADGLALDTDLGRHLPLAAAVLIVATLVVLFAMTGSVVLPVKAVVMNFLSLGAALGVVVFVFQNGHFARLLGTTGQGALESTSPIVLAAVGFGLSTDYGVFLLGRIKEGWDSGLSNRQAVAAGIEHTGRIVTAAAALFCLAMCAIVLGRLAFAKELGFGAALAVILDASIVRAILVPSLMTLLGGANWWAPKPLRILHRRMFPSAATQVAAQASSIDSAGTQTITTSHSEETRA
ncbi:MMPL family transporter [Antrihabitans cavernicola]|uniref:MMPL family transporter n=1 Tax=Antrihabitans cavernicola TaxID=2495913 RepID=A0A5A7S3C5_9NOCA|nr:MMPL family transporter [Spelaeibacter cavernicola]KAA0017035.1 MMPL family transporter [Spelaeibacter cavernicola]